MILTIDTKAKTITVIELNLDEARHFARLHEFDGYEVINFRKSSIPELNKYDAEAEFKLLSTEPITK